MKTDLKKILSISGQSGLFLYLAQAKNGVIVESLATKQRSAFGANAKVTSLGDISIYTNTDEVPLKEVLTNMHNKLGDAPALSHKADSKLITKFFLEVLPDYDQERFYVSHMKKILDWYEVLRQYASFDFVNDEDEEGEVAEEAEGEVAEEAEEKAE